MPKIKIPWTSTENALYTKLYQTTSVKNMLPYFKNRSPTALRVRASKLGISRKVKLDKKNKLEVLLTECPQTYYWLGVLFADGHFYEKRIALTMSTKDSIQAHKYSTYTGTPVKIRSTPIPGKYMCTMYGWDSKVVPILRDRFKIHAHKTYIPCKINHIRNKDLLLSLIIGLIDGDGSITKLPRSSYKITLGMHKNWYKVLVFISKFLTKVSKIPTPLPRIIPGSQAIIQEQNPRIIKSEGTAKLVITNTALCKFIKSTALRLQLPVMSRKWDHIGLARVNMQDRVRLKLKKDLILIKRMRTQGKTLKQIMRATGRGHSGIDMIIKKYKIKNIKPKFFKYNLGK